MPKQMYEQKDFKAGVLGPIYGICSFHDAETTSVTLFAAHEHPRMKLNPLTDASGVFCLETAGTDIAVTVEHDDGRNAGVSAAGATANEWYNWTIDATEDNDIFEEDEPVIAYPSTAGTTGSSVIVFAQFEVLSK